MIQTQNVTFSYSNTQNFQFPDVNCANGETLLITGNSGTGKTTLLHLLGGLLHPSAGTITINQQNIQQLKATQLDAFRGQNIGMILQKSFFIEALSVLDNVVLASWIAQKSKAKEKALNILENLGLKEHVHKLPSQLSIGQQQRVNIARALINNPSVILADEPTSSLDDENALIVAQLLSDLAKEYQTSLVIVTHDQRLKKVFNQQITLI
ncbi:ATP-binding cassette domain-containing protein [Flavobacterium sp. xlx-214]|uniref:ABC transporter ATP-binding protein n=1 Tax=unclassified Flavobacterium TaxID=196869 RepID=UPI0013CFF0C8|nr:MULTISPECIES: ATP-binding cassette domain-containing protein [unclassified Flavobacterium]MBA5792665.1 ATP-binding cassette domain-containing protein [Flavobacterium sp. xlx-221]QMI83813.1 ATP-binding cassette domain-containing protein [Flavobacterium sp. xlx-214]